MNMGDLELTLLSEEEIWGDKNGEGQLDILKKYGTKTAMTDLVILTGGFCSNTKNNKVPDDDTLKGRIGWNYTRTDGKNGNIFVVTSNGSIYWDGISSRDCAIRPIILSSNLFFQIYKNRVTGYNGTEEVEIGEYPQYAPDFDTQQLLENEYQKCNLKTTGRDYTFDSTEYTDFHQKFQPVKYEEYEYNGKKYIRVKANSNSGEYKFKLSNDISYRNDDYVWVEISPVIWLIDDKTKTLVSKRGLLGGIRFHTPDSPYNGDFSTSEMKEYLDKYMMHDLFQSVKIKKISPEKEKRRNPYGLTIENVSEEDILLGAIETDIAAFLHGRSSEGKSARVKQIDPDCTIIYLRNATPESLNGKSVYNAATGEMIDIKPTWLKKLEGKCKKEPDKLHILFFDEITNALPSIQGSAFNIILEKEVDGKWHLPKNARIVAAGNEMSDSLAANQLAEPLFNRFAHVYIETTVEKWLKWASKNNIHPAIYAYIAYKQGKTLRSKYTGEKPNADPRKWEMASKILYKTEKPEMLRALIGEGYTKEFITFCKQQVITLEDVITGNYTEEEIESLNTAERYATTLALTQADDNNLEIVRDFVKKLGSEFLAMFDAFWTHGDENRIERLAEAKIAETSKIKQIKR